MTQLYAVSGHIDGDDVVLAIEDELGIGQPDGRLPRSTWKDGEESFLKIFDRCALLWP